MAAQEKEETIQGNDSNSSRSVDVYFNNKSGQLLTRKTFGLSHGVWSGDSVPPELIADQTTAYWRSESQGLATGTEGFAEYYVGANLAAIVRVAWDNPFWGHNKYSETAPSGYGISHQGGDGDNATVNYVLIEEPEPGPTTR
ncbi:aegerolysin family protein [Sorangium sp. So ce341]|uniref:aegerolysin family protein n=1 Tax=Sorangium sp. So ce341 TaxID=3133302 RepID=UPI003F6125EF